MRLTEEVKQQLESELPPSAAVREELRNYLALTGMSAPEFADAVIEAMEGLLTTPRLL